MAEQAPEQPVASGVVLRAAHVAVRLNRDSWRFELTFKGAVVSQFDGTEGNTNLTARWNGKSEHDSGFAAAEKFPGLVNPISAADGGKVRKRSRIGYRSSQATRRGQSPKRSPASRVSKTCENSRPCFTLLRRSRTPQ